jgi:hypothetical protein
MHIKQLVRPPTQSFTGALFAKSWNKKKLSSEKSLCHNVKIVAQRCFISLLALGAVSLDLLWWVGITASIVLIFKTGFCNHLVNLVSILASLVLTLGIPFGYHPKADQMRLFCQWKKDDKPKECDDPEMWAEQFKAYELPIPQKMAPHSYTPLVNLSTFTKPYNLLNHENSSHHFETFHKLLLAGMAVEPKKNENDPSWQNEDGNTFLHCFFDRLYPNCYATSFRINITDLLLHYSKKGKLQLDLNILNKNNQTALEVFFLYLMRHRPFPDDDTNLIVKLLENGAHANLDFEGYLEKVNEFIGLYYKLAYDHLSLVEIDTSAVKKLLKKAHKEGEIKISEEVKFQLLNLIQLFLEDSNPYVVALGKELHAVWKDTNKLSKFASIGDLPKSIRELIALKPKFLEAQQKWQQSLKTPLQETFEPMAVHFGWGDVMDKQLTSIIAEYV